MKQIIVIGSSNTDMVVKTKRLPSPGETVLGGEFFMTDGGKGANQAAAIAKLGGKVLFVTKLGDDMFGEKALTTYNSYGIDTTHICKIQTPSGVALIMVDDKGENCISVASGANMQLATSDIDALADDFKQTEYLLMQLEIPIDTVCYAAERAMQMGVKVVLNPAPAAVLPEQLLKNIYILTPNKTEAELISGIKINDIETAKKAALEIYKKGVDIVLITLGSQGSLIYIDSEFRHIPARKVDAIDTTAAGDVFNGAMCTYLAEGYSVLESIQFATIASSISVTRSGAQPSIPSREEVNTVLNSVCVN